MNRHSGFTLIELLVTLTIAAILAGVGIPALQNMMMTNRRVAVVNALVADVQHARSTASSLYQPVVLCASTGAGCAEAGSNWANGWLVFVDENDDGVFDAGEKVLSRAAPRRKVRILSNQASFTFHPNFNRVGAAGTLAVCMNAGPDDDRWIAISTTGRPRLETVHPGSGAPTC